VAISCGPDHSLALKSDGTVAAWGDTRPPPPGISNLVAIAAGGDFITANYGFNLGLKKDGTVIAWGDYDSGQTNVPPGLSNVVAIAAGGDQALAITAGLTINQVVFDGQNASVEFRTFSGQNYSVQSSTNLGVSFWTDVAGGLVSGTGFDVLVTDTNKSTAPFRFYRLKSSSP